MPTVPSPALHMPNECAGEPGGGAALAPPRRPAALVLVTKPVQQGCRHHAGRRWIKVDPTERRGGGAAPVVALHGGPLPLRSCKGWCAVLLAALLPHVPGNQTGNQIRHHCAVPAAPPPPPPPPPLPPLLPRSCIVPACCPARGTGITRGACRHWLGRLPARSEVGGSLMAG